MKSPEGLSNEFIKITRIVNFRNSRNFSNLIKFAVLVKTFLSESTLIELYRNESSTKKYHMHILHYYLFKMSLRL